MKDMENFEQKISSIIENKELPEEITGMAEKIYGELQTIIEDNNVQNENVRNYIERNTNFLNNVITNLYENRRREKRENLNYLIDLKGQETDKDIISEINNDNEMNDRYTEEIVLGIKDNIANCKNIIKRDLINRNLDKDEISKVSTDIASFANNIKQEYSAEILEALSKEDLEFEEEFLQEYDRIPEEIQKTEHQKFVDEYKYEAYLEKEMNSIWERERERQEKQEQNDKQKDSQDDLTI